MKTLTNGMLLIFLAVALSGCASSLKKRAAFDLNCPQDRLMVTDIDFYTKGVSGCGQRATYIHHGWVWIANSPNNQILMENK